MGRLFREILTLDNLRQAWDEVADKRGAPGRDNVSIADFAQAWEANLVDLQAEVQSQRYKPGPLERFTIPKRDGSPRHMANLTLRDKILQRAVLRLCDDIYERQFLDCSFGYRPKRGVPQVIERVVLARDLGRVWVLDADIDDFFHSVDHALVKQLLRETMKDEAVLRLFDLWLQHHRHDPSRAVGTPMGAVISPLLANIYLHPLDVSMTQTDNVYLRYADDFIVLCRSQASNSHFEIYLWLKPQANSSSALKRAKNVTRFSAF